MKRVALFLLSIMLMLPTRPSEAETKIRAVATIPDLADMARHIGGDLVEVTCIAGFEAAIDGVRYEIR